jgi:hypothetical protein
MNKVSAYSSSLRIIILMGIFLTGFIVLISLGITAAYGCLVWFVGCIVILIQNYSNYDVHLTQEQIILTAVCVENKFQLADLVIKKVSVVFGPIFIFEINKGSFKISYTKENYAELLKILEYLKFPNTNKFRESVTGYIVSPR